MTLHDDANDDEVGDALAARWQPLQRALLDAAPASPLQAAIILRRLVCPLIGLRRGAPEDHHEGTIKRVIGFLESSERPPSTRLRDMLFDRKRQRTITLSLLALVGEIGIERPLKASIHAKCQPSYQR